MASSGFHDFANAVAVVTGGSSGIGRGIAEALRARGSQVVICAKDEVRLMHVASEIGATPMVVDVTSRDAMADLAARVVDRFGKINIVCNNAGVGPAAPLRSMSHADWQWMMDVNLWGVINGIEAFLDHVLAAPDGGHFVNTSSLTGLWSTRGLGAYCATKAAVIALTETLHAELSDASDTVGATVLCPGPVHSDIKTSQRHRADKGALVDIDISGWFSPEMFLSAAQCGRFVIDAIEDNHLYLLTHPELSAGLTAKTAALEQAFERTRAMMESPLS